MGRRKGGGGSNSLSVSGLETKKTNSRKIHVLYQSLKARLSYFQVTLVIIASEFAIVIEITILSCDCLVVITNEFGIIIKETRLSCDGPVIIAHPDCNFRPRFNLV